MKTVYLGDQHGRTNQELIRLQEPDADKFVYIGDYWDSFDIPFEQQMSNFQNIIQFKKDNMDKVVLLTGNHEMHNILAFGETYSGYQHKYATILDSLMSENLHLMQMAYYDDGVMCTHAGISKVWLSLECKLNDIPYPKTPEEVEQTVNDLFKYDLGAFSFRGLDPYGDSTVSSPIWIRPKSLMHPKSRIPDIVQIVGHTPQSKGIQSKANGKYWFIDALELDQYLVRENGEFKVKTIEH